jgi:hypothetical protein
MHQFTSSAKLKEKFLRILFSYVWFEAKIHEAHKAKSSFFRLNLSQTSLTCQDGATALLCWWFNLGVILFEPEFELVETPQVPNLACILISC